MQASGKVEDDPKEGLQVEASGVKLNATTGKEALSKLTSKNELQNDESESTPLLIQLYRRRAATFARRTRLTAKTRIVRNET